VLFYHQADWSVAQSTLNQGIKPIMAKLDVAYYFAAANTADDKYESSGFGDSQAYR